jgi:hypothetical protein
MPYSHVKEWLMGQRTGDFLVDQKAGWLNVRLLTPFALLRRSCGFVSFFRFLVVLSLSTWGGYIDSVLIEY